MAYVQTRGMANGSGHLLHPMLLPFPIVLFLATLLCDLVYLTNGEAGWAGTARMLLGAGLFTALLAVIAWIMDVMGERAAPATRSYGLHLLGMAAAVGVEGYSYYLRHAEGAASVTGSVLTLSVVGAALLGLSSWMGASARRAEAAR